MAGTDVEKSSYGAFERFLFFATPIIFTVVLLGVLFALFDNNLMNGILKTANKIPVLEKIVPDPKTTADKVNLTGAGAGKDEGQASTDKLMQAIKEKDAELQKAVAANQEKDQAIKDLKNQIATLEEQLNSKKQSDEEYRAQVQQLASIYAKMNPSKAAPILESMTPKETVLVLSEMKPDDRVRILEKMDPKKAAEASIQLKDTVPAKDRQIAALQERLKINAESGTPDPQKIGKDELGKTFSEMDPKSAAAILLEMNAGNQPKVLSILSAMDSAGRSRVLGELAKLSKQTAASLSAKLME